MNSVQSLPDLTSGRLLARNTIWNLAGQLLPMGVAIVTIPPLVAGLGTARFGVLSIAWVVIGYFSLFDLGIGRALTKLVAEKAGSQEEHAIPALVWMSLLLLLLLGVLGGAGTAVMSPWLVRKALKIPAELQPETLLSFYLLALSLPLLTVTSGLRGTLEALQRFRVLNLIRIPMTIYSFAGPLLVLPFSRQLVPVIAVLVAGRLIGCLVHLLACFRILPSLWHRFELDYRLTPPLLRIGGWITACNVLGPAILYVDRFLIASLLSLTAVTYYTAPFDMVSRLLIVPAAISGVLFPAFAQTNVRDQDRTRLLLMRGLKYIVLALFPLVVILVILAPEILRLWLGSVFAENSTAVFRWLVVGILLNSVTSIPFGLLQAIGRADIDGKLLILELPVYAAAAWVVIGRFGIEGASMLWALRTAIETVIVIALSLRLLPKKTSNIKSFLLSAVGMASLLYIGTLWTSLAYKAIFLVCALAAFAAACWLVILTDSEKSFLASSLRILSPGLSRLTALSGREDAGA